MSGLGNVAIISKTIQTILEKVDKWLVKTPNEKAVDEKDKAMEDQKDFEKGGRPKW